LRHFFWDDAPLQHEERPRRNRERRHGVTTSEGLKQRARGGHPRRPEVDREHVLRYAVGARAPLPLSCKRVSTAGTLPVARSCLAGLDCALLGVCLEANQSTLG